LLLNAGDVLDVLLGFDFRWGEKRQPGGIRGLFLTVALRLLAREVGGGFGGELKGLGR